MLNLVHEEFCKCIKNLIVWGEVDLIGGEVGALGGGGQGLPLRTPLDETLIGLNFHVQVLMLPLPSSCSLT